MGVIIVNAKMIRGVRRGTYIAPRATLDATYALCIPTASEIASAAKQAEPPTTQHTILKLEQQP